MWTTIVHMKGSVAVRAGNPLYSAYVLGALRRYGRLRYRPGAFPEFDIPGRLAFILPDGLRIFLDADDHTALDKTALEWCDAYGMVNLVPNDALANHKVIPLGPAFAARPWTQLGTLVHGVYAVTTDHSLSKHGRRQVAGRYRLLQSNRLPVSAYEPGESEERYVFFVSRHWAGRAPDLDERREAFIAEVRARPGLSFEGGLVSDSPAADRSDVMTDRYSAKAYLERTRRSAFVFNTPAVDGCHGWKLGEFLALGKAIITTPLVRALPAPLIHGEHVHYIDDRAGSLAEAIDRLTEDLPYRRRLEHGARSYWEEWLEPTAMLGRLIDHAIVRRRDDLPRRDGETVQGGTVNSQASRS